MRSWSSMAMARGFWKRPSETPRRPHTNSSRPIVFASLLHPVTKPAAKAAKAGRHCLRVIRHNGERATTDGGGQYRCDFAISAGRTFRDRDSPIVHRGDYGDYTVHS